MTAMKTTAIHTPLFQENDDLEQFITQAIDSQLGGLPEKCVLVVTSKIISYAQGRLVEKKTGERKEKLNLARQEADQYLPNSYSRFDMIMAIKNHTLTVNAGVDESNASGKYVLWPEKMQAVVNQLWQFLRQHYQVKHLGVIVTDSRTWPLRWGVIGTCLVHCGFQQLTDYIGQEDLFGREITMVKVNVAEAIAAAAALEMGEVAEQTPLGLVEEIKQIQFQDQPPTEQELKELRIEIENDVYGPLLTA
ncbi:MAG: hypothetical protein GF381_02740, partial [Candidatus Pacebacteria bacterium]|nr:hypothetical protein [Candidatus Paceibacterota bacterium]